MSTEGNGSHTGGDASTAQPPGIIDALNVREAARASAVEGTGSVGASSFSQPSGAGRNDTVAINRGTIPLARRDPNIPVLKKASEASKPPTRKRRNAASNESASDANKPTKRRRADKFTSKSKGKEPVKALERPEAHGDQDGAPGSDDETETDFDLSAASAGSDLEISNIDDENALCLSESEHEIEDSDDEMVGLFDKVDDVPQAPCQPETSDEMDKDDPNADDEQVYPLLFIRLLIIISVLVAYAKDFFQSHQDNTTNNGIDGHPMTRHWARWLSRQHKRHLTHVYMKCMPAKTKRVLNLQTVDDEALKGMQTGCNKANLPGVYYNWLSTIAHYIGSGTSLQGWLEGIAQRTSKHLRLWFDANVRGKRNHLLQTKTVQQSTHIQEFLKPGCKMILYIIGLFDPKVDKRLVLGFEAVMDLWWSFFMLLIATQSRRNMPAQLPLGCSSRKSIAN